MGMGGVNSAGTQVNRYLDALGMPDAFGDKIGMLVDLKMGNMQGAMRNAVDLASGLSTGQMDQLQGMKGNIAFSRAFSPRCHFSGPHLHRHRMTYPMHERVGRQAHIGQKYDTGHKFFGMKIQGRISGKQYMGSFFKPVRLGKSGYLFRGRTYQNLGAINKDMRDGRVDGLATRRMTVTGWARTPMMMRMPHMLGSCFTPGLNIAAQLGKIFAAGPGMLGGIPQGIGGAQGAGGAQGGGGAQGAETGSILSNPNMSLEDKLMLLMAKLSEHLDKQINEKMGELEKLTKGGDKAGGAGGAGGKSGGGGIGGLFGSIGKMAGGIAGTAFGGPLGGMLGSKAGGMLGGLLGGIAGGGGAQGASGGAGGAAGGAKGGDANKSNIQTLQTQLQSLMQKRQQMFQTMQNIMKSMHDTSLAAVRNLKA